MMTLMRKLLDALKLKSTREMEKVEEISTSESKKEQYPNSHDRYYENMAKQKENNLQITYNDVGCYDFMPFDLGKPFISDGYFMAIELEGENLQKAYKYLHIVHNILEPYKRLFEDTAFPNKIGTDY